MLARTAEAKSGMGIGNIVKDCWLHWKTADLICLLPISGSVGCGETNVVRYSDPCPYIEDETRFTMQYNCPMVRWKSPLFLTGVLFDDVSPPHYPYADLSASTMESKCFFRQ
jgi:hypothetical protein